MFISQNKTIVSEIHDGQDTNIDFSYIEPCFLNRKHWISHPPLDLYDSASHYLAHQVSRQPNILINHVQRIYLHAAAKNTEHTYAALLDLYLILGEKGEKLRKRLSFQCKKFLNAEQYNVLSELSLHSENAQNEYPVLAHSILCRILSNRNIVSRTENNKELHVQNVIDEARDRVDYGQVNEAQTLLEKALIESPERADIATDLLEIYRYTRNREALSDMLSNLTKTQFKDAHTWKTIASELEQYERQLESH
ncbi:hypothetical protein MNBD_GAMMA16-1661 [hydrothermal vent metagenome]|uniref:Tetratricopeptide repeat protein n=1 Tax=hydrothermal vent metagenome TaxID=652676 RepID=A0A3B0YWI2_9ZZZZ